MAIGTGALGLPVFACGPACYGIGIGMFMIPTGMLMVVAFATGAVTFPFLKAKLMNQSVITLVKRNGKLSFVPGDYKTGSATIETKNDGSYFMLQGAMYNTAGVPTGLAFEDYGVSLTPEFIAACSILDRKGISNYDEMIKEAGGMLSHVEGQRQTNGGEQ